MDNGTPSTESSLPAMDMCHRPSVSQPDAVPPFGRDIGTFSSVSRLVRVTAWCSRFLTNCRVKSSVPRYGSLTIAELQSSLYRWIAHVQSCTYHKELAVLQRRSLAITGNLRVYLDAHGLPRCQGRIESAALSEQTTNPILPPAKGRLTKLIIDDSHRQILHAGTAQTLSHIRTK